MKYFYEQIKKEDDIVMRGVINTPDDFDENKKYPSVIIFHGFGGDRNGSVNFRIDHAKYLTERGYVVFRFDFSGSGESDGSFYDMTVSREEKELEMIHDFAKMKYYVDKDRLYWIGHSLGGVLASLMAYKLKPRAMALLAPASDMNNKDYLKVMAKTVFEGEVSGKTKIESNMPYESLISKVKEADIGGVKIHINFLIDFIVKDIYGSASKYDGNVLIIRGTDDTLVFRDSNEKLRDSYKNARYFEIEGADHSFTNEDQRKILYEMSYKFFEEN